MMENQIAQIAQSLPTQSAGKFPGKTIPNPSENVNSVALRSEKSLVGSENKECEEGNLDEDIAPMVEKPAEKNLEKKNTSSSKSPAPYVPPIPFPQRLARAKLDKQFERFLEVFKQVYVNIPFVEVLQQMPTYAKFIKDILANRRSLDNRETVTLIHKRLPDKLKDPGSFSIPCLIGSKKFDKALCDLGASVSLMPLSVCKKLDIGELKPTGMTIQLADRSVKHPVGVLENVLVKIGKFVIPGDFVVLDMEEDTQIPIILGRPFLATAGVKVDVKQGKLSLNMNDETIEFNIGKTRKQSSPENFCRLDSSYKKHEREVINPTIGDPLKMSLTGEKDLELKGLQESKKAQRRLNLTMKEEEKKEVFKPP